MHSPLQGTGNNPIQGATTGTSVYMLVVVPLESSFSEKDLGVLVDTKFNTSQLCVFAAKTASSIYGCVGRDVDNRSKEVILLLYSALARQN